MYIAKQINLDSPISSKVQLFKTNTSLFFVNLFDALKFYDIYCPLVIKHLSPHIPKRVSTIALSNTSYNARENHIMENIEIKGNYQLSITKMLYATYKDC